MKKAYDIVYKEHILIYSMETMKPSEEEFKYIIKQYINLVIKLIGPSVKESLIVLYGNEQTLFFNIAEYFNTMYEEDQIYKTSSDNLTNSGI
jgi:hypothetical protein